MVILQLLTMVFHKIIKNCVNLFMYYFYETKTYCCIKSDNRINTRNQG